MQFTLSVLAVLGLAAAQSSTTTGAPSGTSSSPTAEQTCLNACATGDVNCQAQCVGVPFPNGAQVNATTSCAYACPQGDGSEAETQAYAQCLAKCSNEYYFTSSGTVNVANAESTNGGSAVQYNSAAAMTTGSNNGTAAGAAGATMTGSASHSGASGSGSMTTAASTGSARSSASGSGQASGTASSSAAAASSSSAAASPATYFTSLQLGGLLGLVMAVFAL
ncbi:hypothetical protein LTR78_006424 [Recurvomyces mirabilis]|uniref:Uncharacterized protein n=1 Tax=Recurvomyces mirabilis TaxID=574656 RepID=A0AAE1C0G3_9PEZI|nr:hypothetical protein LTR78_006424 [Recurvomyces mirabilis]KAK5152311.1 hypothetical protein LTS14_008688 [Recurvomyces mirabilis]